LESTTKKLLEQATICQSAIIGSAFIQDLTKMEPEKLTLSLMRFDKPFFIQQKTVFKRDLNTVF
jgi:hypothetical protein